MDYATFKKITGLDMAEADFDDIKRLYYENYQICPDEGEFCKYVQQLLQVPFFMEIARRSALRARCCDIYRQEQEEDTELMLKKGATYHDAELLGRVYYRITRGKAIALKVKNHLGLTDEDREYIIEHLK